MDVLWFATSWKTFVQKGMNFPTWSLKTTVKLWAPETLGVSLLLHKCGKQFLASNKFLSLLLFSGMSRRGRNHKNGNCQSQKIDFFSAIKLLGQTLHNHLLSIKWWKGSWTVASIMTPLATHLDNKQDGAHPKTKWQLARRTMPTYKSLLITSDCVWSLAAL
jgi:hypothetical protein